jgi:hypothetical protein
MLTFPKDETSCLLNLNSRLTLTWKYCVLSFPQSKNDRTFNYTDCQGKKEEHAGHLTLRWTVTVQRGEHLADTFPVKNVLEQDVLLPLLFNFALKYAIMRVKQTGKD